MRPADRARCRSARRRCTGSSPGAIARPRRVLGAVARRPGSACRPWSARRWPSRSGAAGFRVDQIEVTGLERMDQLTVYAVALDQQIARDAAGRSGRGARASCSRYGWVADARVSRRLPDTLRRRHRRARAGARSGRISGRLVLIDAQGVLLEPVSRRRDARSAAGDRRRRATRRSRRYQTLLDAAPALKPRGRRRRPGSATGAGT